MKTPKIFFILILTLLGAWLIFRLILWHNTPFVLAELKNLDQVERISLVHEDTSTGKNYLLKTIEDPQKVSSIVGLFSFYADKWQYQHYPASPPGPLEVKFYKNSEVIATIDIAYRHKNSGETSFYLSKFLGASRSLEEEEFENLIRVLEVDKNLAEAN